MEGIVLIIMFVCGQPDTVIVKFPDNPKPIVTHDVYDPGVMKALSDVIKAKPIIIPYEDDRGTCA